MITSLGKNCSFSLLCVSFLNVYQSVYNRLSHLFFVSWMWDSKVLIPDHCFSIYLANEKFCYVN